MTPAQLNAFVQVARARTLGEAAEQLHLSQPALSIAIKKLESRLGGQLFSRARRQVELTPEGRAFLPVAVRLLKDWGTAFDDMHGLFSLRRGTLQIAAMPSFACSHLPGLLQALKQAHPNIVVRIEDVIMEEAMERVLQSQAEMAFVFEPKDATGLHFTPLFADNFMLVVPYTHSLAGEDAVPMPRIVPEPLVTLARGSTIRYWLEQALEALESEPVIAAEVNQLATLGEMVKQGIGIGIVPQLCQAQMQSLGLRCLPLSGNPISHSVGVVTRSRANLSVAARHLLALCKPET